jgi:hypothetical protein
MTSSINPKRIALLIPSTSNGRPEWATYRDTYLYAYTLRTFGITYDKGHHYKFYIGIDRDDKIYDSAKVKQFFERFVGILTNVSIEFVYMDGIDKGHLTVMWNRLFELAYRDGFDYFFQCGDDISFQTKGWVNACIETLERDKLRGNMGMTGPLNNNARILTQSFVSRKHMELFGHYFPPEIINWCCDDWINGVYVQLGAFYPLREHVCINVGGDPRYVVANSPARQMRLQQTVMELRQECARIVERDVRRIFSEQSPLL